MSQSREHKKRYHERLRNMERFNDWLKAEPPMWRVIKWHKWKNNRPSLYESRVEVFHVRLGQ